MSVSRLKRVLRLAFPVVALALGAALAVGIVSCGGRDEQGLLPGENAQQIVDNLNQVEQDVANGDCDAAAENAAEVQSQIDALGDDVNAQLRQRLEEGADELVTLVPEQCEEATTPIETTTTTEETTTDEEPTTTDEEETTTTTTSPTTTTTTTTPTSPIVPAPGTGGGVAPPGQGDEGSGDGGDSGEGSG
jgi:hypothetical protein